jgi:hypothetical protein
VDGSNVYLYCSSASTTVSDPTGQWGVSFHYDLTLKLASWAEFNCAGLIAKLANRPDTDSREAKRSFLSFDEERWAQAREWHFPANPSGTVVPDSHAARDKVDQGIADCDIVVFAEGLHPYQDSWPHQGTPAFAGMGHHRGAYWKPKRKMRRLGGRKGPPRHTYDWEAGHWVRTDGSLHAALSESADSTVLFPASAREAAKATYDALLDFANKCPCACPGGTRTQTKKRPKPREWVKARLLAEFSGRDVRTGDTDKKRRVAYYGR